MTDRRHAIVLLARTLLDLEPAPETWTGSLVRRSGSRGEAPSRWAACDACSGGEEPGWIVDRWRRRHPCEACGGRPAVAGEDGRLLEPARGGKGRVRVDAYTGRPVRAVDSEAPALTRPVTCGRCHGGGVLTGRRRGERCPKCGGSGELQVPVVSRRLVLADQGDDATVDALVDAFDPQVRARNRQGSYRELEAALAELARRSLHRWRVFHRVHVVGELDPVTDLRERELRWLGEALDDLARWMPDPVRVPAWAIAADRAARAKLRGSGRHVDRAALDQRDDELRRRYDAGERAAALAVEFGIGPGAVLRAVERAEARERRAVAS